MILKYYIYQNQYKDIGEFYEFITPNTFLYALAECLRDNTIILDEMDIIAVDNYKLNAISELNNVLVKLGADDDAILDVNTFNIDMLEDIPAVNDTTAIYNAIQKDLQNIAIIEKYYPNDPK